MKTYPAARFQYFKSQDFKLQMSAFGFIDEPTNHDGDIDNEENADEDDDYAFGEEFADQSQSSDINFGAIDDSAPEKPTTQTFEFLSKEQDSKTYKPASKKTGSRVIGRKKAETSKKAKTPAKKSAASKFARKPSLNQTPQSGNLPSFAKPKTFSPQEPKQTTFDEFLSATSSDPEYPLPSDGMSPKSTQRNPNNSFSNDARQSDLSTSSSCRAPADKSMFSFDTKSDDRFGFLNTENDNLSNNNTSITSNSISNNYGGFDFAAAEENGEKEFNFGSPSNTFKPTQPSTFSYGSEEKSVTPKNADKQLNRLNSRPNFSFGGDNDNPFSFSSEKDDENEQNSPFRKNVSITPEIEDFDTKYTKQLQNYKNQAFSFHEKIKNVQMSISNFEKERSEALSNDKYEYADQLSHKINVGLSQINDSLNGFATSLECALNLANDAPKHMTEHSLSSQQDIPQLRVRQSALSKRLASLVDLQETDKETLEMERSKVTSKINEITIPLTEHKKVHEIQAKNLEERMNECQRPFKHRIAEYQVENESHNKRIAELMAEIDAHKKAIRTINSKINDEEKLMKKSLERFLLEQKELKNDENLIISESRIVTMKKKELEAPYQELQNTVKKRDAEIATLSSVLEKVQLELHEAEQDVDESQSASEIILDVCAKHGEFKVKRSIVKQKFDAANKAAINAEIRRNQINMEISELATEKEKAIKQIEEAKIQIPQLDSSKKAYVSTKNFKGAQQVANLLKETQDRLEASKAYLNNAETKLSNLQIEESTIKENNAKLAADVEEAKKDLDKTDFDFYSNISDLLLALCHSSPFAAKLLQPLKELVLFAVKVTEPPKELTKEELHEKLNELNEKLSNAVNEEDFETADDLQREIDKITVKIERLSENNV
ncbi:UvrB/uvrC motif family protein [Tritrichomonas foetus]|uniref:UvrB/uvrC motif family protein n=1 Tax=Tritrichomonas foetus TaxID=1144522 RepID=A0A1J4KAM2_9EUKA|nr:UvrB/uvrC motif family protein [Tritrichomonas foetus]|eukprot:OHT06748.1 UvrB/uvrC motif family protein [Tritrichomonas foetus]